MKLHKFVNDFFHNGRVKYAAGSAYVPNEETRLAVASQHATEVEAPESSAAAHFGEVAAKPAPEPKKPIEPPAKK